MPIRHVVLKEKEFEKLKTGKFKPLDKLELSDADVAAVMRSAKKVLPPGTPEPLIRFVVCQIRDGSGAVSCLLPLPPNLMPWVHQFDVLRQPSTPGARTEAKGKTRHRASGGPRFATLKDMRSVSTRHLIGSATSLGARPPSLPPDPPQLRHSRSSG